MKIRRRTGVIAVVAALLLSGIAAVALLLRPERLRRVLLETLQASLTDEFIAEIDSVEWTWEDGIRATGVRLREKGADAPVLDVPSMRAGTRLWSLLRRGAITDLELGNPSLYLRRDADGTFPLARALRPAPPSTGPGEAAVHPRVRITGGLLRFSDPSLLAEGEDLVLQVETLDLQESVRGEPAAISALLVETGSSSAPGIGALGRLVVRGTWPPGPRGLHVLLQTMDVGSVVRDRLAPALRTAADAVVMEGTAGTESGLPGLEVVLTGGVGEKPITTEIKFRPEDVALMVRGFPALLTGVKGEIRWRDGIVELNPLELHRGAAVIQVEGRVDLTDPADPSGRIALWARDLYLDRGLRDALPPGVQRVWDAYDFAGTVDITEAAPDQPASFDSWLSFPGGGAPPEYRITVELKDGMLMFHGYPDATGERRGFEYMATEVRGRVSVASEGKATRVQIADITAKHGDVSIRANGHVLDFPGGGSDVRIDVFARDVPLDDEIRSAFEDPAVFDRWRPKGTAAEVQVLVRQDLDLDVKAYENVLVRFDGRASFEFEGFPLRLDDVSGVVEDRKDRSPDGLVPRITLQGIRGSRPDGGRFQVDGSVEGAHGNARLNLDVRGQDVTIDDSLRAALASDPRRAAAVETWDRLRPSGRASLRGTVSGTESDTRVALDVDLGGTVAVGGWGDIRMPVGNMQGSVVIDPDLVTLRGIVGDGEHGAVRLPEGTVREGPEGARVDVILEADDIPLDESIRADLGAVADRMKGYFEFVRPAPGFRGDLRVHLYGIGDAIEAGVEARDLRGGIEPMGLRNLDIGGGTVTYDRGMVELVGVEGSMANRDLVVKQGRLDLDKGSGSLALEVRRLRFPQDLVGLVPEDTAAAIERQTPDRYFHVENLRVELAENWRRMILDGELSLSPQREGPSAGLGLEGVFGLRAVTLLRGMEPGAPTALSGTIAIRKGYLLAGVPFRNLDANLELGGTVDGGEGLRARVSDLSAMVAGRALTTGSAHMSLLDGEFMLREFRARFADGELEATFRAGPTRPAYEGVVTLRAAAARALFVPGDLTSRISGTVNGEFTFKSPSGEFEKLQGNARAALTDGHLAEVRGVPVFELLYTPLLDNPSEPPVITSADIRAELRADRFNVKQLELRAPLIDLVLARGDNVIRLDGGLDLAFDPVFKRGDSILGIKFAKQLVSPIIGPVFRRLAQVQVRGTLQQPEVGLGVLPGLRLQEDDRYRFSAPPPAVEPKLRPPIDF